MQEIVSKKKRIIYKTLLCFLCSIVPYISILFYKEYLLIVGNTYQLPLSIVFAELIILSTIGSLLLIKIHNKLYEKPAIIYDFMSILNSQILISSYLYLLIHMFFEINNENRKYDILHKTIIFIFIALIYIIKQRKDLINLKNLINIILMIMFIYGSGLKELILISIYLFIVYLISKNKRILNNINKFIYKLTNIIMFIFIFITILVVIKMKLSIISLAILMLSNVIFIYTLLKYNKYTNADANMEKIKIYGDM